MANSSSLLHFILLFLFVAAHYLPLLADSQFEGFDVDEDADVEDSILHDPSDLPLRSPPVTRSDPIAPPVPKSSEESVSGSDSDRDSDPTTSSDPLAKPTTATSFEYWDEDEFEGFPSDQSASETPVITESTTPSSDRKQAESSEGEKRQVDVAPVKKSYTIEIVCVSFLIMFAINFFAGKRENENIALAWAAKFATKDSIFDKNFSLLGIGEKEDSPLLLKEGQTVFKFYASGRRFCQGLLATMELKSRHDLIARLFSFVVPSRDEITFEVYMNDDAMDHIIFALAKKKAAKAMQKEVRDLNKFASLVSAPSGKKWVTDELTVISESKEVAGDLITEAVLDQVFGEKAFGKFGKGFISLHFSDQYASTHKRVLLFKFALPDVNHMADMTRLVALVPYYIDLIGRYKLSPQARSKTEAARSKAAQEEHKERLNARQEALQKKKAERKKLLEETEAKLSAEALRKKEAKERARQMKKAMPKIKMSRH